MRVALGLSLLPDWYCRVSPRVGRVVRSGGSFINNIKLFVKHTFIYNFKISLIIIYIFYQRLNFTRFEV